MLDCVHHYKLFSRYCPEHGHPVSILNHAYTCEGYNSHRNSETMDDFIHVEIQPSNIKEVIVSGVTSDNIVKFSGVYHYFTYYDYNNNNFVIYDLVQKREIGRSVHLSPGLNIKISSPIFDGLFFNAVCGDTLIRFGLNRDCNDVINYKYKLNELSNSNEIESPIIIRSKDNCLLVFIIKNDLFFYDITTNRSPLLLNRINLSLYSVSKNYYPLLYDTVTKTFFIVSYQGTVLTCRILDSHPEIEVLKVFDFHSIFYPLIIYDSLYLGGYVGDLFKIVKIQVNNQQITSNQFRLPDNVKFSEIKNFPLHNKMDLLMINQYNRSKMFPINVQGLRNPIQLDHELSQTNYFIREEILYSLQKNDNLVRRFDLTSNRFVNPSFPLELQPNEKFAFIYYLNKNIIVLTDHRIIIKNIN